jgi:NAD(P)-dependent dehydrogenase (short-subunit alcohol dehydrogenase family)
MSQTPKVAIVTGAARGIGLATAQLFQSHDYRVALVDRDESEVLKSAAGIENSIAIACDISSPADVSHMIETVMNSFGRIDALVNNAYPRNKNYGKKNKEDGFSKHCFYFNFCK